MNKFRFHREDFGETSLITKELAANIANRLLDEHLAKCQVVYTEMDTGDTWSDNQCLDDTHKAVLFNIEELVKEPCKHEVGRWEHSFGTTSGFCKHCGVKLKVATWEAAE
jgi:uncharacterized protein involved in tolerance to divalent cations